MEKLTTQPCPGCNAAGCCIELVGSRVRGAGGRALIFGCVRCVGQVHKGRGRGRCRRNFVRISNRKKRPAAEWLERSEDPPHQLTKKVSTATSSPAPPPLAQARACPRSRALPPLRGAGGLRDWCRPSRHSWWKRGPTCACSSSSSARNAAT